MTRLERTLAMGFETEDCVTLEQLQYKKDNQIGFEDVLIDIEKILLPYAPVYVSEAQARRFLNGGALSLDRIKKKISNEIYRVYSPDGLFLGLGEGDLVKNELVVKRLLSKRD